MRVCVLPGRNPGPYTGDGTNTYFLPGRVPTLIDAGVGVPEHLDEIDRAVRDLAGAEASLAQVLVTHAHVDHVGGATAIAARWPSARFAKRPCPGRDERYSVPWQPIADHSTVPAGDLSLWAVPTPGHAPDHLSFFEPNSGILFGGDLVINDGTVVIPVSHGGNLADYLASLRRVLELQPRRILPGHGRPIDQPGPLLRGYLAHRLARERQILDALGREPLPIDGIVRRVYGSVPAGLELAAAENVLAHLLKLRDEGRATGEAPPKGPVIWRASPGA